jgi:hypothetical protein
MMHRAPRQNDDGIFMVFYDDESDFLDVQLSKHHIIPIVLQLTGL